MTRSNLSRTAGLATCTAALVLAGAAAADKQNVRDKRGEPHVVEQFPHCDIVNAKAGHKGNRLLLHKVKIASALPEGEVPPPIVISRTGNDGTEPDYYVTIDGVRNMKTGKVKKARHSSNKKGTVHKYLFNKRAIGKPKKYGWQAEGPPCGDSTDVAPGTLLDDGWPNRRYRMHKTSPKAKSSVVGARAAGRNRNVVVDDPKDSGKLYEKEIYARCDIREVKSQLKRRKLLTKVTLRGSQKGNMNTYLHLNTRGGKRSEPEYVIQPGFEGEGRLYRTGGISEFGAFEDPKDKGTVRVKEKNRGKAVQFEVPVKKIGSPKKTGFQAKTCGEGAVDIAPGKTHFDDRNFTGRVDFRFANIKTGR